MSLVIHRARLAYADDDEAEREFSLSIQDGTLRSIVPSDTTTPGNDGQPVVDANGGVLLPALCHAHIHLDKCYLLSNADHPPIKTGDFPEALHLTAEAKKRFPTAYKDLLERGDRLVRESLLAGVMVMRAHAEVDAIVGNSCINVALELRNRWEGKFDVQIALFAQERLFDSADSKEMGTNAAAMTELLLQYGDDASQRFSAIGSAPYVESSFKQSQASIRFILEQALRHGLHADFHLDYDLKSLPDFPATADASQSPPLIYDVIRQLRELKWNETAQGKTITIGHATRLTLFNDAQLKELRHLIGDLPVHFVGLPQSDIYMMGRSTDDLPERPVGGCCAPRGTINAPYLSRVYNIRTSLAINNVQNAFTPQGYADPLSIVPLSVALFQDATIPTLRGLLECVSTSAMTAIGIQGGSSLVPTVGSPADFVILPGNKTLRDAALSPSPERITIRRGRVISSRRLTDTIAL